MLGENSGARRESSADAPPPDPRLLGDQAPRSRSHPGIRALRRPALAHPARRRSGRPARPGRLPLGPLRFPGRGDADRRLRRAADAGSRRPDDRRRRDHTLAQAAVAPAARHLWDPRRRRDRRAGPARCRALRGDRAGRRAALRGGDARPRARLRRHGLRAARRPRQRHQRADRPDAPGAASLAVRGERAGGRP